MISFIALALTPIVAILTREIIARITASRKLPLLEEIKHQIPRFIYLIGCFIAVDFAPLPFRLSLWLNNAIYIIGVIMVMSAIRQVLLSAARWGGGLSGNQLLLAQGFMPVIRNLSTLLVVTIGSIMVLRHFGYDVWSLVTALGVGSLAFGLAAKDTLSHMISGFTLMIDRNLRPGDQVALAGETGEVEEIGLRSTRIRTGNGSTLIVPNTELVNTRILNLSQPSRSKAVTSKFVVRHQSEYSQVREIALRCGQGIPGTLGSKLPAVSLSQLTERGQLIQTTIWIEDLSQEAAVISAFNERVSKELRAAQIALVEIPTP